MVALAMVGWWGLVVRLKREMTRLHLDPSHLVAYNPPGESVCTDAAVEKGDENLCILHPL